jgi:hypothetical protein
MKRISSILMVALALGTLVAGMSGCRKEGPAERAGKEIDQTTEKAGHQLEKTGNKVKDAIKDLKN